jgi:hypothetical protein
MSGIDKLYCGVLEFALLSLDRGEMASSLLLCSVMPTDTIYEVFDQLSQSSDLSALSLVSKHLHKCLLEYEAVATKMDKWALGRLKEENPPFYTRTEEGYPVYTRKSIEDNIDRVLITAMTCHSSEFRHMEVHFIKSVIHNSWNGLPHRDPVRRYVWATWIFQTKFSGMS